MTTLIVLAATSSTVAFVFGLLCGRLVGRRSAPPEEILRIHMRANLAERQIHDLTREAFVAMAEFAEAQYGARPIVPRD